MFLIPSGVLQGGHLSSWLFLIFLRNIGSYFKSYKYKLFANDLKLYHTTFNIIDCRTFQNDIHRLLKWCITNKLSIKVSKFHFTELKIEYILHIQLKMIFYLT